MDAWVGIVRGFRLTDSGDIAALSALDGFTLVSHICLGFPRIWTGSVLAWTIHIFGGLGGATTNHYVSTEAISKATISLLPWLSPKEESPSIFVAAPPANLSFGDLIEPKPAMPNPGQTANGINPEVSTNKRSFGKLIRQTPERKARNP